MTLSGFSRQDATDAKTRDFLGVVRKPKPDERRLVEYLAAKANLTLDMEALVVEDMNDGGMGSLRLYPRPTTSHVRRFGRQAADCRFLDADGIDVIASLYLDSSGEPFELDVWKG